MLANRRAIPAIAAGVASLAAAAVAVASDTAWLVVAAAALALVSVVLVLSSGSPRRRGAGDPSAPAAAEPAATDTPAGDVPPSATPLAASSPTVDLTRGAASVAGGNAAEGSGTAPPEAPIAPGVIDPATGLFNQIFFDASLVKRVSAARRSLRPLSVAIADIAAKASTPGGAPVPAPAPEVGRIMLDVFREADLLARADDGRYLILLEDTPENGAVWTLERLRRRLAEELPGHTLWVGVSCYPAYGFGAQQLIAQARRALVAAREWQQDRIEVTAESPED